jgi:HJR/Mrr/RecB family endonuclease
VRTRAFLSETRNDWPVSRVLADLLLSEGIEVRTVGDIAAGRSYNWSGEILSAIKACDVYIALFRDESKNTLLELGFALGCGKPVLLVLSGKPHLPLEIASFPISVIDIANPNTTSEFVETVKRITAHSQRVHSELQGAKESLQLMCKSDDYLDSIETRTFEEIISRFLFDLGFNTTLLAPRNEVGIDISIVEFLPNVKAIVEVKKLSRAGRVGLSDVQRVIGAAFYAKAQRALMITAGDFTSSARFCAQESPIKMSLITIDELVEMSREDIVNHVTKVA